MVILAGAERDQGLRFGLLGQLEVTRLGTQVTVPGPKRRALLAMLLLRPGEIISLERLVDDIWDGRPPSQARSTIQSHISHLRRDLGLGRDSLVARTPGYQLDVDPGSIDLRQFEHALDRALGQGAPRLISDGLKEALSLWRGPALVEFAEAAWAAPEAARLEMRRDLAIEALAEADLALGRHVAVVADLERLVVAEPLRETRWILLMTALQRAGRHVEALRAAHRYRMTLREAGLGPSPAFERAEHAVVHYEPVEPTSLSPSSTRALPRVRLTREGSPAADQRRFLPLVGRTTELACLQSAVDAAQEGHPGLVLVSGEPGVGKSRLVDELARRALSSGPTVLLGRCDDALAVPYQPFVEVLQALVDAEQGDAPALESHLGPRPEYLARLAPDIVRILPHLTRPTGHDPDIERYHLFEAISAWLATLAADDVILLVIEDLHWATRPTLLLLRHLLRSLRSERLCIVATCRTTEMAHRGERESLLIDITQHARCEVLDLPGLDNREVDELIGLWGVRAELGASFAATLSSATSGNPFFVTEILRHLSETARPGDRTSLNAGQLPLPPSLQAVVRQRIGRLSAPAEEVLLRAAIAGREFSVRALLDLEDLDGAVLADALEEAHGAGFVEPVEGSALTYQFCHDVVRDVLLADLPEVRKAVLHREAGLALETAAGDRDDVTLVELARHFTAAARLGEEARAVRYSRRAGDQAMARYAADDAVAHYSTALLHFDDSDEADEHDRCDLLIDLGEAQRRLPNPGHRETFLRAARTARRLGNPTHLARAAKGIARGFLLADVADHERVEIIESAVACFQDPNDPTRARLLASLAGEQRLAGESATSEATMEQAVLAARRSGDIVTMTETQLMQWDMLLHPATLAPRRAMATALASYFPKLQDPDLRARIAATRVTLALEAGDGRAAQERLADLELEAAVAGGPQMAWATPLVRSVVAVAFGRLDDAEKEATSALDASHADNRVGVDVAVLGQLIHIARLRGRLSTWEPVLATQGAGRPVADSLLALAWCEMGRRADASAKLDLLLGRGDEILAPDITWAPGMVMLAELVRRLGARHHAARLAALLQPFHRQFVASAFYFMGPIAHALGDLATADNDLAAARRWYTEAERRAAAVPSPIFVTRAQQARSALASSAVPVTFQGDQAR